MTDQYSTFNNRVEELTNDAFHVSEILLLKVLNEVDKEMPDEATHKLYAAIVMASAPLKFIATLISKGDKADEKRAVAGKETMLIAALLTARTAWPTEGGETVVVNFTPRNVLAALEAANLIATKDLSGFICSQMLEEYKRGSEVHGQTTFGYWDYLESIGPNFDTFGDDISNFSIKNKTRH